jgi:hypothetical protein
MNDLVHNLLANPVQPFIASAQFGHVECDDVLEFYGIKKEDIDPDSPYLKSW